MGNVRDYKTHLLEQLQDTEEAAAYLNAAERDLRKLIIWRKKSYGTRSERGKRFVERITIVSQTLRKHGHKCPFFHSESHCKLLLQEPTSLYF